MAFGVAMNSLHKLLTIERSNDAHSFVGRRTRSVQLALGTPCQAALGLQNLLLAAAGHTFRDMIHNVEILMCTKTTNK